MHKHIYTIVSTISQTLLVVQKHTCTLVYDVCVCVYFFPISSLNVLQLKKNNVMI